MAKVLPCNSIEISSSDEGFLLIFRFRSPDGFSDSVYVTISPAGAVVLNESLEKELTDFIEKHGNIELGTWKRHNNNNHSDCNQKTYLS